MAFDVNSQETLDAIAQSQIVYLNRATEMTAEMTLPGITLETEAEVMQAMDVLSHQLLTEAFNAGRNFAGLEESDPDEEFQENLLGAIAFVVGLGLEDPAVATVKMFLMAWAEGSLSGV
jgi:hypothetical protein